DGLARSLRAFRQLHGAALHRDGHRPADVDLHDGTTWRRVTGPGALRVLVGREPPSRIRTTAGGGQPPRRAASVRCMTSTRTAADPRVAPESPTNGGAR